MSSNETYLFPIGQRAITVTGADFLSGYLAGYKRAPLNQGEHISDCDIACFLTTHTPDTEQDEQAVSQAGFVVGAIAALVELLRGDCQIQLAHSSTQKCRNNHAASLSSHGGRGAAHRKEGHA